VLLVFAFLIVPAALELRAEQLVAQNLVPATPATVVPQSIRTLSPINLEKDVEFYEVSLRPGGALRSQAHFEGTREFLTVEEGSVRIESDQDKDDLTKGDSGTYRADVPHAIVNAGKADALVFLVVIYR
jgi:mannose-6-phosphate isomerase-like protein (cupin superfamily)